MPDYPGRLTVHGTLAGLCPRSSDEPCIYLLLCQHSPFCPFLLRTTDGTWMQHLQKQPKEQLTCDQISSDLSFARTLPFQPRSVCSRPLRIPDPTITSMLFAFITINKKQTIGVTSTKLAKKLSEDHDTGFHFQNLPQGQHTHHATVTFMGPQRCCRVF